MEWLGCMDMLSGGNFADGSCCHSLAKFMAFCRQVAALIFWYQWFPCPGVAAAAGIARGCFPHPSATGNHPPAYARANCHISWH